MRPRLASTNGHRPTIVGTGLLAADVLLDGHRSKIGGLFAGGTCGNVLTILGAFGWTSRPVARLGLDVAGRIIQDDMHAWGVDLSLIVESSDFRSPVYFHSLHRREGSVPVHHFSRECPECGTVLPGFQPVPQTVVQTIVGSLGEVDVFFADRVSRGAVTLASRCRDRGALVVFEPSSATNPKMFLEMLSLSHVVKYSDERGKKIVPLISEASDLCCLVIETMGDKGLRFQFAQGKLDQSGWTALEPVAPTEVLDTAGAGDWFSAAFVHTIGKSGASKFLELEREMLEHSLTIGQHFAAWSCAFKGARGGMYKSEQQLEFSELLLSHTGQTLGKMDRVKTEVFCRAASDLCPTCPTVDSSVSILWSQRTN